jgi:chloramphenicol 3-O-phosphotransferase
MPIQGERFMRTEETAKGNFNDCKVILIAGRGASGKSRMAREIARGRGGDFKVLVWDSMKKSLPWVDAQKGNAQTLIIEGLTLKAFTDSGEFLKRLMDESEQYLVFTMLTYEPLPVADGLRIDRIIDLNERLTE